MKMREYIHILFLFTLLFKFC